MHLKSGPKNTLQFDALKTQEPNPENSPLSQLVLKHINSVTKANTQHAQTSTASKPPICINIFKQAKEDYLGHWSNQTTIQCISKFYLTIKREYKLAEM